MSMLLTITTPPGVSRKLASLYISEDDEGMSLFKSILSHGVSFSYLETISISSRMEKEEITSEREGKISSKNSVCICLPFTWYTHYMYSTAHQQQTTATGSHCVSLIFLSTCLHIAFLSLTSTNVECVCIERPTNKGLCPTSSFFDQLYQFPIPL